MTPAGIRATCVEARDAQIARGTAAPYLVVFNLPWRASGERVRLCKVAGPIGHVVATDNEKTTAMFDADRVIAWIDKYEWNVDGSARRKIEGARIPDA